MRNLIIITLLSWAFLAGVRSTEITLPPVSAPQNRSTEITLPPVSVPQNRPAEKNPAPVTQPRPAATEPLTVHFFFTPTCPLCEPAKKAVAAAEARFGNKIAVKRHNHSQNKQAFNALILALEYYKREDTPNLAVFAGNVCLDDNAIKTRLEATLERLLKEKAVTPDFAQFGVVDTPAGQTVLPGNNPPGGKKSPPTVSSVVKNNPPAAPAAPDAAARARRAVEKRTTLPVLMAAGFVDGFNPCAFATVILFVSMLSAVGRDRRTILAIGLSFIVAVFITYYALGLAFFKIMEVLSASATFKFVALGIKWLALLMVLVAGVLSLIDFWKALRSDGKEKMLLVLPDGLKDRIRKRLRATAHDGSLLVGAFMSGIIVSLLEAACTGQTYMPVITGLIGDGLEVTNSYLLQLTAPGGETLFKLGISEKFLCGCWLLLIYNILFIIPLLAVFIMAFFGMTSEQIGNVARKKVWVTKLCLALVFLAMAAWLGGMLLGF